MYKKILNNLKKLFKTGFFSIVISNTLVKIVSFLGGMILVRVLSKNDYGIYSYVMNALGFLLVFGDLGVGMATLQLTQENHEDIDKFKAYCVYGLRQTIIFSIVPVVCVLLSPWYYPFTIEEGKTLILLLFLLPIVNNLNTFFQTNLRIHLQNSKYANLCLISIIVHYMILLPMSLQFGVLGAVLANYVYGGITLVISIFFNRKYIYWDHSIRYNLNRAERKQFFKLALPSQANAMMAQILILIDVFLIGVFFGSSEVIASYKVATTIPAACSFVPVSIMVYAIPYFSRNIDNYSWLVNNSKKILILTVALCSLIGLGGIITSSWVIPLIFGNQYSDAIVCYNILLIGFIFSGGLQTPCVNILFTQRKVKWNLYITSICGALNVILDIIGIKLYASTGAAIATMISQLVSAIVALICVIIVLKRKGLYNERI